MSFERRVDRAAWSALVFELTLAPKPGLVTPFSRGSHRDMDHRHFNASIDALNGFFGDCARLAAAGADLRALQARGVLAETAMFAATGGINTHKGAIFTLGLLAAAAGRQRARGEHAPAELGNVVAEEWGNALLDAAEAAYTATQQLGMPEARIPLAHACVALCLAPKSTRAYRALNAAYDALREPGIASLPVPLHLRNAPTRLLREMGCGAEYKYPPNYRDGRVRQEYMPDGMIGRRFLEDRDLGTETDPDLEMRDA